MKSFDVKMEKANAIFKYRRLHKITTLFRFMEVFAFLVMISRFSYQLPFAVKVSGDYFRGFTFTVLSPKFVFVIGNVIILILFLKSRVTENSDGNGKADLCYDYVRSCERSLINAPVVTSTSIVTVPSNKRMICRSRSENPIRAKCKENKTHRELRRSVTEISRSKSFGHGCDDTAATEKRCEKEELSSEDFRRTVEAFIARQQKILRDEEFSPMVYIGS
ncbi:protein of unknown function DUF4408 [Cynara cardunculus var. scolymus]|uniref:DUF4408 domain-containing protein n=2 Tax=Cynara cardunculus var. scolymus TaxID=59895 RepID=A0A124SF33_CYNCS|nr:protein of unknown function DUF4408 [Cynara cardunculus var. scolymus]